MTLALLVATFALGGAQEMKTATAKGGGFSISVPKSWVPINANDPDFKKMLKELAKKNPSTAQYFERAASSDVFAMMLMDGTQIGKGFANNLNLTVRPGPPSIGERDLPAIKQQLNTLPFTKPPTVGLAKLPCGQAVHYFGTLTQNGPTGKITNDIDGWLLLDAKSKKLYTLSISIGQGKLASMRTFLDKMVSSIRFK